MLPLFETARPDDDRPRAALEHLDRWVADGQFVMAEVRASSLGAHAAARELSDPSGGRAAARAAGQAIGTSHVPEHATGAAIYAGMAIRDRHLPFGEGPGESAARTERRWQHERLGALAESCTCSSQEPRRSLWRG